MKVLKPTAMEVEIGPLVGRLRLPMAGRLRKGIPTKCDACGHEIKDEFFIGGFVAGHPNLKLHEGCAPVAD